MGFNSVDEHVARSKLQMTDSTGYVSHFITIWKGRPLVVSFNHLVNGISNLYYLEMLDGDEVIFIEQIIRDYLNYQEDLTNEK